MQKRKLKERNLNLSIWLDREKRLTFVETAGVSLTFVETAIIVKQKDARVQAHIRKGKKKKEKFQFLQKNIIVDVVMMRAVDIWVETTRGLFWLNSYIRKERKGQLVLQNYFFPTLCG